MNPAPPFKPDSAVEIAPGVHWIGVLDPGLRSFDIILKSPNGTSYNAYVVRGSEGVAVIDTVKACFADDFFRHLESVANYDEITTIVLNHLEPDHSGALPELLRRALAALDRHGNRISHRDRIAIADFDAPSANPRFHLIDLVGGAALRLADRQLDQQGEQ